MCRTMYYKYDSIETKIGTIYRTTMIDRFGFFAGRKYRVELSQEYFWFIHHAYSGMAIPTSFSTYKALLEYVEKNGVNETAKKVVA